MPPLWFLLWQYSSPETNFCISDLLPQYFYTANHQEHEPMSTDLFHETVFQCSGWAALLALIVLTGISDLVRVSTGTTNVPGPLDLILLHI